MNCGTVIAPALFDRKMHDAAMYDPYIVRVGGINWVDWHRECEVETDVLPLYGIAAGLRT